jgi:hypothetical protein
MLRITDSLALLAIEAGQVNNPSEQSGAAGSSRLDVDQRSIDIGEPVPIVFGLRREDKGGILISPGASECRFENDVSNNVTAYYHLVLSEGRLEIVETLDVFQRACRVGEHVQGYGARAGFWEPGNFLVKRGSNPIPEATYICGSIGLYPDITSLSFKVTIPNGFDQWKKQVHVFIRYGMKVKRFLQRGTGASDNFCDLVLWMLRSSKRVPEALIDLEQLAASARFLEANGLTCNCYIKEAQNYSDLIAKWAPYFLLIPSNRNGKKGLRPVLPTNPDGTINTSPVTIEYTFDEDLIVPDSFSVEYTNFADRQPFVAQVIWRQELGDEAPIMRTLEIGAPGSDRELGPFESFDLSEICTSENHAAKAGAFIVANRIFVSHSITFTPKPQSHQTLLSVGSIIRVVLTRLTVGTQPCKHDYLYQVQRVYKNFDGKTQYDCRHFPINPERQSIVALAVAGAEGTGILLESPKTGVTCDTNTGGTTGSGVTGGNGGGTTQPRCYQIGLFVGAISWVCEGEPEGEKWEKDPDNDTWEFTGDEDPTGPGWEFDEEEEKWKWTGDEDPTDPGWEFDPEDDTWKWTGDGEPTGDGWQYDPTDDTWKWTGDEDPTDPGWEFDPEDDTWKWTGDGEPTGDGWQYDPTDDTWKWTGDGEPTGDGWQYDPTDDTWKWTGDGEPTGDGWQYDPTDDTWKWTGDGEPTGDGWGFDPEEDEWIWAGDGVPPGDDPVSLGTIDDPNSGTGPALGALPGADLGDFGGIGDIGGGGALGGSGSSEGDGEGLGEVEANPSDGGDATPVGPFEEEPVPGGPAVQPPAGICEGAVITRIIGNIGDEGNAISETVEEYSIPLTPPEALGGDDYNGKFVEFRVTCPNGEEQVIDSFEPGFDPGIYQFARYVGNGWGNGFFSPPAFFTFSTGWFNISSGQTLALTYPALSVISPNGTSGAWTASATFTANSGASGSAAQGQSLAYRSSSGGTISAAGLGGPGWQISSITSDRRIMVYSGSFEFSNDGGATVAATWPGETAPNHDEDFFNT